MGVCWRTIGTARISPRTKTHSVFHNRSVSFERVKDEASLTESSTTATPPDSVRVSHGSCRCRLSSLNSILALVIPSEVDSDDGEYVCRYLEEFQASGSNFREKIVYDFIMAKQRQAQIDTQSSRLGMSSHTLRDDEEFKLTAFYLIPLNAAPFTQRYMKVVERYPLCSSTTE